MIVAWPSQRILSMLIVITHHHQVGHADEQSIVHDPRDRVHLAM